MIILRDKKGIALVMVMVISLIGLAVVSMLLYMLTVGTRSSGGYKFFRTADDIALGGAETAEEFIKNRGQPVSNLLNKAGLYAMLSSCVQDKLVNARGSNFSSPQWSICTAASPSPDLSLDPTRSPDLQFDTSNVGGLPQYTVFVKIVDTVPGNSSTSDLVTGGGSLGSSGVVEATTGIVSPPHNPYLYRVEIQAQEKNRPRERAKYSGLYVY